jgi:hypothetical protein
MRQIDAFVSRAQRCDFRIDISFASLLFGADQTLFEHICKPEQCLHLILPPVKTSQYHLSERGHKHLLREAQTMELSCMKIFSAPLVSNIVTVSTLSY